MTTRNAVWRENRNDRRLVSAPESTGACSERRRGRGDLPPPQLVHLGKAFRRARPGPGRSRRPPKHSQSAGRLYPGAQSLGETGAMVEGTSTDVERSGGGIDTS